MSADNKVPIATLTFKTFKEVPIQLDVYPPSSSTTSMNAHVGAVLYYHGGGFTFANRKFMFPTWLQKRITDAGFAFISADYRLIPTGSITGHEILEDVKDAFAFLRDADAFGSALDALEDKGELPFHKFSINPDKIAVAGSSAGGMCAYLAAIHVNPKPAAIVSIFGMGGDVLIPQYFQPKTEPFIRGRPLFDPEQSKDYIWPLSSSISSTIISDSPMTFHPPTATTPAIPSNPRMPLAFLYLQLGTYLDYYTGSHEPSLSAALRYVYSSNEGTTTKEKLRALIPERHRAIFPQFGVDASWPPVFLLHGAEDTAVPVEESKEILDLLRGAGVESYLRIVDGEDHFFDQAPDAEEKFRYYFDKTAHFLIKRLA